MKQSICTVVRDDGVRGSNPRTPRPDRTTSRITSKEVAPLFAYKRAEDCPSFFDHTPCPPGYLQWHDWAKKMLRTHRQVRCTRCRFYAIWEPRRAAP
jgi:hypothetical protein